MRALRRLAAVAILVTGTVGAGVAFDPPSGYAVGDLGLDVTPKSGAPDAHVTLTYRWPATRHGKHFVACTPSEVTFQWDGSVLGRAPATPAGDTCVAILDAVPPAAARAAGTHAIGVTNDASARARYVLTDDTPSAGPSDGTAGSVPDPGASDPGVVPVPDSAGPTAVTEGQGTGMGISGWLIAFGLVLVAAGAATFAFIVRQIRHPKSDAVESWPDTVTQPVPVRGLAARRPARGAHRQSDRFTFIPGHDPRDAGEWPD
jgi:hypothetical protein